MTGETDEHKRGRTRWGRARYGGGAAALWLGAGAIGLAVAVGIGGILAWTRAPGVRGIAFVVGAVITLPIACALGWAVLVDRDTIAGAVERPDESIEHAWYERAASGALPDAFMAAAFGGAMFAITGWEVPAGAVLSVLSTLIAIDVAVRYWVHRRAVA